MDKRLWQATHIKAKAIDGTGPTHNVANGHQQCSNLVVSGKLAECAAQESSKKAQCVPEGNADGTCGNFLSQVQCNRMESLRL
jgi:hypothetical protein